MKLTQDENDKSNNVFQKIKYNLSKNIINQARLYSSFKQRPITSTKMKKSWKINKLSTNNDKSSFDMPYFGYNFHTSKYFPNKLYLSKNSFVWGKNKLKKPNKYYEKEELFDRVIKLQNTVNKLNNKNNKQQIEINKQKKEIKKQNKILNEVNVKFFFDKLLKNEEEEIFYGTGGWDRSKEKDKDKDNSDNKAIVPLSKRRSYSTEELNEKNYNNIANKLIDNLNYNNLKELYKKILKQNDIKEQEILRLKQKIDSIKFSNETLVSNMKLQYKQLQNENNKKIQEFDELKKSSKCTKYNEVMKEKEIYEKEMLKIKNKFYKALRLLEKYKNCYEENKILNEELNKKRLKINKLENEIILFSKNSENLIESLKKEINKKNKKIQKLENEMKKYVCLYNNIQKEDEKKINIYNNNRGGYKIIIPNPNQNINNNDNYESNVEYNNINLNNNFNNINIKENEIVLQNNNNINNNQNNNDNSEDDIYNKNKNKQIYVNHCLNFSNKNNINNANNQNNIISQSHSSQSSRANLFSASWKSINLRKEKINNIENNNIIKNSRIIEIINLYPELFQLYIEMKKRNINDNKTFINEVLQKLKEENSIIDNKKIYYESIITLFNIEDSNGKKIIEDLSNKEFEENKTLQEIKIHHIKLFNELFNYKRENDNNSNKDTFIQKLCEINNDEFINIINKYDTCESGYIFFNQMILVIKEIKLEEYFEDILLLTKEPDIFDLMDYNNILNIIKSKNIENNENKEINENNDNDKNNEHNDKDKENKDKENNDNENKEKENEGNENKDNENKDKDISNNVEKNDNINKDEETNNNENINKEEEEIKNNAENNEDINKDENTNKDENNSNNNNDDKKEENKNNNNNSSTKNVEKESKIIEDKQNIEGSEKIFKNFAHIILIEGSTPSVYINSLKELVKIGEDNNQYEVIDPEKFFNFLEKKNISATDEEKNEIIKEYGIKIEDKYQYIDYDKIVEKIFDYMKNDEGISNDEDFMKNIKSMEIEGFD